MAGTAESAADAAVGTSVWQQRPKNHGYKKGGGDEREERLCDEAHAINNRWTSSNDDSRRDDGDKTTASDDGMSVSEAGDDKFVVATALPTKKRKFHCRFVPRKAR